MLFPRDRGSYKDFFLAPEGFPFIVGSFILVLIFPGSFIPYLFLFLFLFFFRNPKRQVPEKESLVVSPADGKVIGIDEDGDRVVISIFMSLLDVHVNRVPLGGVVEDIKYERGKFYPAFKKDLARENEKNTVVFRSGDVTYSVTQVAGVIARRIVCYLRRGDRVKKGEVMGIICFGSLVQVSFPRKRFKAFVRVGKRVKAGETIIGEVVHAGK